jgi:hypothetical protein
MSCDWNLHCVTCNSTHGFDDANHQIKLMMLLIKHRHAIAGLDSLNLETEMLGHELAVDVGYGRIRTRWFATHHNHELRPIDEFGRLHRQCRENVTCGSCSTRHMCTLDEGHAGPHLNTSLISSSPMASS